MTDDTAQPLKKKSLWEPQFPVPSNAPAAKIKHSVRGEPQRVFPYRDAEGQDLGYTCRFITSSGEPIHLPLTWCKDQEGLFAWRWIQFPRLRPLYGLDALAKKDREADQILLVFDELSAEHAKFLVPWLTPVSWPGGIRNIDEVDWSQLRGYSVWIFPPRSQTRAKPLRRDAEDTGGKILPRDRQPAWIATLKLERILRGYGCAVPGIFDPFSDDALPDDWDIGMAGQADWSADRLNEWMLSHMKEGEGTAAQKRLRALRGQTETPPALPPVPVIETNWEDLLVYKRGDLAICTANIADILLNSPEWKGVFGYDDFEKKTYKLKPPPFQGGEVGEWGDSDDTWTSMWLARKYGFTPSSTMVSEAVRAVAERLFKFNPVQDWLKGLVWDGTPRIDHWLTDFMGVDASEYSMLVGRFFMLALISRAMKPGEQFKYCLILEGGQDAGKSKALRILGGRWYGDNDLDLHNKDSMVAIQGKLLYEFAELDSLSRAESSRTKSFLSRQVDEFRPHYGRSMIKCPRQTVFAGSVNGNYEYLKDPTGAVRFWSVSCDDEINHAGLIDIRDQLFAEALVRWKNEERFWPTREQQERIFTPQQLRRERTESLVDMLHDWVYSQAANFSLATAMLKGLNLDASKMTENMNTRVGIALSKLGCTRVEQRNGIVRYWYKPPQKVATSTTALPAQQESGVSDVPF